MPVPPLYAIANRHKLLKRLQLDVFVKIIIFVTPYQHSLPLTLYSGENLATLQLT